MPREFQFQVTPEVATQEELLKQYVAKLFHVSPKEIQKVNVLKRSIDARQKSIKINIKALVYFRITSYNVCYTKLLRGCFSVNGSSKVSALSNSPFSK